MKKQILFASLLFFTGAFADAPLRLHRPANEAPWFTGPLLTPSAYVVKAGHVNFEPYVYATAINGVYDSDWDYVSTPTIWSVVTQSYLQIGLTPWMEVQIVPTTTEAITQKASSFQLNDLPIQLQIQLYTPGTDTALPAVKLTLGEVFPIGKYNRLNPSLQGTDSAGSGCYQTVVGLTLGSLFHLGGIYFSALRIAAYEAFPTSVHVRGINAYGGALDTDGTVYPGFSTEVFIGWEISLARHWTFAIDGFADFQNQTTFTGKQGSGGSLNSGSSAQYSLAPAIEWNWGRNIGLISGVWFTFAGRNSDQFISWTTALNYYY